MTITPVNSYETLVARLKTMEEMLQLLRERPIDISLLDKRISEMDLKQLIYPIDKAAGKALKTELSIFKRLVVSQNVDSLVISQERITLLVRFLFYRSYLSTTVLDDPTHTLFPEPILKGNFAEAERLMKCHHFNLLFARSNACIEKEFQPLNSCRYVLQGVCTHGRVDILRWLIEKKVDLNFYFPEAWKISDDFFPSVNCSHSHPLIAALFDNQELDINVRIQTVRLLMSAKSALQMHNPFHVNEIVPKIVRSLSTDKVNIIAQLLFESVREDTIEMHSCQHNAAPEFRDDNNPYSHFLPHSIISCFLDKIGEEEKSQIFPAYQFLLVAIFHGVKILEEDLPGTWLVLFDEEDLEEYQSPRSWIDNRPACLSKYFEEKTLITLSEAEKMREEIFNRNLNRQVRTIANLNLALHSYIPNDCRDIITQYVCLSGRSLRILTARECYEKQFKSRCW